MRHVLAIEEVLAELLGFKRVLAAGDPVLLHLLDECGLGGIVHLLGGLLEGIVEHHLALAGMLLVLGEVEIAAGRNALELLTPKREVILDIHACAGIVGEFVGLLPVFHETLGGKTDGVQELLALFNPVLVPNLPAPVILDGTVEIGIVGERYDLAVKNLHRLVGTDEELKLHLLELAAAERIVARSNFVAEALAHLRNAKRNLLARRGKDVLELREDRLGGLGTQVCNIGRIFDRADNRLEHQIERLRLGKFAAAVRTEEVASGDLRLRLFLLLLVDVLDLVGAHELLAILAHRHGVGERIKMAGSLPDFRVHDDRGVKAGHIAAAANGELPPCLLHVLLELAAERTVVPETGHSAIDLGGMVDETAALAQRRQRVKTRLILFSHDYYILINKIFGYFTKSHPPFQPSGYKADFSPRAFRPPYPCADEEHEHVHNHRRPQRDHRGMKPIRREKYRHPERKRHDEHPHHHKTGVASPLQRTGKYHISNITILPHDHQHKKLKTEREKRLLISWRNAASKHHEEFAVEHKHERGGNKHIQFAENNRPVPALERSVRIASTLMLSNQHARADCDTLYRCYQQVVHRESRI